MQNEGAAGELGAESEARQPDGAHRGPPTREPQPSKHCARAGRVRKRQVLSASDGEARMRHGPVRVHRVSAEVGGAADQLHLQTGMHDGDGRSLPPTLD